MKKLNFSYNWNNKLNCNAFTTIRLYYDGRFNINDEYEITLKGEHFKYAKVVGIKTFKLPQLNDFMAYIDTGYDAQKTKDIIKKMYSNKFDDIDNVMFCYILLETIKK